MSLFRPARGTVLAAVLASAVAVLLVAGPAGAAATTTIRAGRSFGPITTLANQVIPRLVADTDLGAVARTQNGPGPRGPPARRRGHRRVRALAVRPVERRTTTHWLTPDGVPGALRRVARPTSRLVRSYADPRSGCSSTTSRRPRRPHARDRHRRPGRSGRSAWRSTSSARRARARSSSPTPPRPTVSRPARASSACSACRASLEDSSSPVRAANAGMTGQGQCVRRDVCTGLLGPKGPVVGLRPARDRLWVRASPSASSARARPPDVIHALRRVRGDAGIRTFPCRSFSRTPAR